MFSTFSKFHWHMKNLVWSECTYIWRHCLNVNKLQEVEIHQCGVGVRFCVAHSRGTQLMGVGTDKPSAIVQTREIASLALSPACTFLIHLPRVQWQPPHLPTHLQFHRGPPWRGFHLVSFQVEQKLFLCRLGSWTWSQYLINVVFFHLTFALRN